MINSTMLWFMLLPIVAGLIVWWYTGHNRDHLPGVGVTVVASSAIVAAIFLISSSAATSDVEIWNGQVLDKKREHGHYLRSYQCNCSTSCSGSGSSRSCSTTCQTCYEDRYTVNWACSTTIGSITIEHLDRGSRSVYNTPDPQRYTQVQKGDPVSARNDYTNYVQAVPESLFNAVSEADRQRFAPLIPSYPDGIYDIYRVNRFLSPGHSVPDVREWNDGISELLKVRGPVKQVNVIVVIAKTSDPSYAYALRDAWQGANKNDVVLVIGATSYPTIDFVEVLSWTKSEIFKVQLRDEVKALGSVDREKVLAAVGAHIDKSFERRRMREFAYLESEIDPPLWLSALVLVLILAGSIAAVYFLNGQSWKPRPTNRWRR